MQQVIGRAFTEEYINEKRREPRIPVELPVELYFNMQFWRTKTRNLSLHGMQAVWPERKLIGDILCRMAREKHMFPVCRLYLEGKNQSPHNIPLDLRYITEHDDNGNLLLGFKFQDLNLTQKTRLYEALTV